MIKDVRYQDRLLTGEFLALVPMEEMEQTVMLKKIHAKAGSLSDYFGYIILLFCWYLLNNMYSTMLPELPGTAIGPILDWGLRLLIGPIVFAGLYGGVNNRQKTQDVFASNLFLNAVKSNFWRIVGANLLFFISFYIVTIIAFLVAGYEQPNIEDNKLLLGIISVSYSAIGLFWFSAVVVERKIFRGLISSLRTLLSNPIALFIGILWGLIGFSDTLLFDFQSEQIPVLINVVRSGVLAVFRVLAVMYALACYKNIRGISDEDVQDGLYLDQSTKITPGEKLVRVSFGFAFASFIPLFHLAALILGFVAMKREKRFSLRAAIACWTGGFFTIVYFLLIVGVFASKPDGLPAPGYAFLAEANADLAPYIDLFEQGALQEIQKRLGDDSLNNPDRHWSFDCALALAKFDAYDTEGALADFYTALQKNPEKSEFYYFYGIALLANEKEEMAVEKFQLALERQPDLEIAEQYITLIQTAYEPSLVVSSLMFIVILLILFTLHEYGHAFAAWKLGDDTAKDQGRLTLNPIPHLDIFGSILLPAVLLLRQSDAIFGWARPVPVNPQNFSDPQKDHMRVAFAGPAVNLMVSMVCFVILACIMLLLRLLWPETVSMNFSAPFSAVSVIGPPFARWIVIIIVFLKQLFYTSLVLGFFNLIPVPPLDGSWIFAGLLPQGLRNFFEKARQFSFVIFLLLVITPALDYFLAIPFGVAWVGLQVLVSVMGFA